MNKHILVTYATRHGATAEIAAKIALTIRKHGVAVTLRPLAYTTDPAEFNAVVLGSAVYAGRWRNEAVKFLKQHATTLAERPVWLFSSGPTGEGDPVDLLQGWRYPEALQAEIDVIAPRELAVFHGEIDPKSLGFLERFVIKRMATPVGDYRDWEAITAWADGIAEALTEEQPEPAPAVAA